MSEKGNINRRHALRQLAILPVGGLLAGWGEKEAIETMYPSNSKSNVSKNILVLASSARKGGNSDLLSEEFIRGAKEAGHATEKLYLANKHIRGCLGCGICRNDDNNCVQRDDMDDIYGKMQQADILVLASPVYFYSFNAQMKTVLDRTYALHGVLSDKTVYLIATGAAPAREYMSVIVDSFRRYIGCFTNMKEGGIIYGVGVSDKGDVKGTPAMQEAYSMGSFL
jgi:multimeric flavodoxin WrbA